MNQFGDFSYSACFPHYHMAMAHVFVQRKPYWDRSLNKLITDSRWCRKRGKWNSYSESYILLFSLGHSLSSLLITKIDIIIIKLLIPTIWGRLGESYPSIELHERQYHYYSFVTVTYGLPIFSKYPALINLICPRIEDMNCFWKCNTILIYFLPVIIGYT